VTGKRDIIKEGKQAENVHEEKKCSGRGKFQNWIGGGGGCWGMVLMPKFRPLYLG
jgi:hypothetical protein